MILKLSFNPNHSMMPWFLMELNVSELVLSKAFCTLYLQDPFLLGLSVHRWGTSERQRTFWKSQLIMLTSTSYRKVKQSEGFGFRRLFLISCSRMDHCSISKTASPMSSHNFSIHSIFPFSVQQYTGEEHTDQCSKVFSSPTICVPFLYNPRSCWALLAAPIPEPNTPPNAASRDAHRPIVLLF